MANYHQKGRVIPIDQPPVNTPFGPIKPGTPLIITLRVSKAPILRETQADDDTRNYVPKVSDAHKNSFLYSQSGKFVTFDGKYMVLEAEGEASTFSIGGRITGRETRLKTMHVPVKGIIELN